MDVAWEGNVLTASDTFTSVGESNEFIQGIYFVLPMYLNVAFADPPFVERVDGDIAQVPFRWELLEWTAPTITTTQQDQEERAMMAWTRLALSAGGTGSRLLAALHYFHVACRLARTAATPGEFIAETLLNMEKALAVLFPHAGDGKTMEAARRGLTTLGYSAAEVDRRFIPAMALRNKHRRRSRRSLGLYDRATHADPQLHGKGGEMVPRNVSRLLMKVLNAENTGFPCIGRSRQTRTLAEYLTYEGNRDSSAKWSALPQMHLRT